MKAISVNAFILATGLLFSTAANAEDFYLTLGVPRNASEATIKIAYRKLAMAYHPDRFAGESKQFLEDKSSKFQAVDEAYQTLSDRKRRAAYDRHGEIPSVDAMLDTLSSPNLTPEEMTTALEQLTDSNSRLISRLISSEDTKLWKRYSTAMLQIGEHPKYATIDALKALLLAETSQSLTFGLSTHMSNGSSWFDDLAISRTTGRLLNHLGNDPNSNAQEIVRELVEFTTTRAYFDVVVPGRGLFYEPQLSHDVARDLYEFAVQKKMIRDSATLVSFTNDFAAKILESGGRESNRNIFLKASLEYTLNTLKSASDQEVIFILKTLKKMDQALVFEELVRSGRLASMSTDVILVVMESAKAFVFHYAENPQFGPTYQKLGNDIQLRIHHASLAFTRTFQAKSPSRDEVRKFIELAGFRRGQYTRERFRRYELPERDYKLVDSFAPRGANKTQGSLAIQGPAQRSCEGLFRATNIETYHK